MFTVNHVSLHGTDRPRLNDISLKIAPGRTAIIGYSGAGKTSLLNLLAGFETPDSGRVIMSPGNSCPGVIPVSGQQPLTPSALRTPLFWVPQNGGLWPHLSVEQHLQTVNKSRELADEILLSLDLTHRKGAFPDELSQGERSRLSLARALAASAEVLLMDEPLSHVDPVRKPGYWDFVVAMTEKNSTSLVFSSHEPETVLRRSDSVICLDEGKVLFQGITRNLYEHPSSLFLAELLGPVNWFSPVEQQEFGFTGDGITGIGIRPERMKINIDQTGKLEYVKCLYDGASMESILRDTSSGTQRIVKHLRLAVPLQEGNRVSLEIR